MARAAGAALPARPVGLSGSLLALVDSPRQVTRYTDWLAAAARQVGGRQAVEQMFRSAEAYRQMWERAVER